VGQFNKPGQLFYVLQDANYNLTGLTTSSGTIHQQYTFGPYGELLFAEDAAAASIDFSADPTLIASPFGFQTMWYDAETGLICIRHRCYNPVTARWYSADPIEQGLVLATSLTNTAQSMNLSAYITPPAQYVGGLNAYLYVDGNPVTGLDPSGLMAEEAGHIVPAFLGGAQDGPIVMMAVPDHKAYDDTFRQLGFHTRRDADVFWGRRPATRGEFKGVFTDDDRRGLMQTALSRAGFDVASPETQAVIDDALAAADQKGKLTKGRRGGGRIVELPRFRDAGIGPGIDPKTKQYSRKRFMADTGGKGGRGFLKAFKNGGAGAILTGGLIVLGLHQSQAHASYLELIEHTQRVRAKRGGASLYDEIEALSIISDLNGQLGGNAFTIYGGWNYWREEFDLYRNADRNVWWAR
jgi:RHS repeat-associated protein